MNKKKTAECQYWSSVAFSFSLPFPTLQFSRKRCSKGSIIFLAQFPLLSWWSSSQISPQQSEQIIAASIATPSLLLIHRETKSQKLLGSSLNFQFNGIIIVSSRRNISPFRPENSRPADYKPTRGRMKIFASESLEVVVTMPLPFPSLLSWTHEYWLWEKQHPILDTESEYRTS